MTAIPDELKLPAAGLTVTTSTNTYTNIQCTGKLLTSFLVCSGFPALTTLNNNSTVSATVPHGVHSRAASTTTSNTVITDAAGVVASLPVTSSLGFTNRTFWVNSPETHPTPPSSVLVTCGGYETTGANTPHFDNCSWSGNAAPTNVNTNTYTIASNSVQTTGAAQIGGFIKIEKQDSAGVWTDVTMEILNFGIADRNQEGTICNTASPDPNPDAILRFQRLRDNGGACDYFPEHRSARLLAEPVVRHARRQLPQRRGERVGIGHARRRRHGIHLARHDQSRAMVLGQPGRNRQRRLEQQRLHRLLLGSPRQSQRRREPDRHIETGEYGFEDFVNPPNADGSPNSTLDGGTTGAENVNELDIPTNTTRETYGEDPNDCGGACTNVFDSGWPELYDERARPWLFFTSTNGGNPGIARVNRPVLFRRALKLVRGGIVSGVNPLPASGVTVAAENPVYVQGNYNTTTVNNATGNVPCAIFADAVSLLSNNWSDHKSFRYPNSATSRDATTTGYRFAVVAGKGKSFTWPSAGTPHFLFGTDGGVGNFLRLLEDWNISGVAINYRGSMVSLYHSRQAVGTFKYGTNVYDYGDRNFNFDDNFLMPALLPPGTPMFRDVNTLTFRQILRPTQ